MECAKNVFLSYHTSNLCKKLEVHLCLSSVISPELRHWSKVLSDALTLPDVVQRGAPPLLFTSAVTCLSLSASGFACSSPSAHSTHSAAVIQKPNKCPCLWASTTEVLPFGGRNRGWCLGIWRGSIRVNVWSVSSLWFRDWVFLPLFQMEISVSHSLVPMGSARTILENFPAFVTKAGRGFCAIMVMLSLIHYKITFFVTGISV